MEQYEVIISSGPDGSGFSELTIRVYDKPESAIPFVLAINNGTASARLVKVTEGKEDVDVYSFHQNGQG